MDPALLPVAIDLAGENLTSDLLPSLGGAAAALALLGALLLLPLYVAQRREVARLLEWQERHPEAGEQAAQLERAAAVSSATTGAMSAAAQRVTSERPALARIGTAERDAIELERAPFWRRVVERGPRHPLVISLLALLVAGALFVAAALLLRANDDEGPSPNRVIASEVEVVVLNASSQVGLGGKVADDVAANNFVVADTTAASDTVQASVVRYADGAKAEARVVAQRLGILSIQPFDTEAEAAAEGAPVVVILGEDLTKGSSEPK